MNFDRLQTFLKERKEPAYRLTQAKQAFFVNLGESWDDVTVFSKALREACAVEIPWDEVTAVNVKESPDTIKTLFACGDGKSGEARRGPAAKVEAVLMCHQDERNTVCVSSQVGCAMACAFCATGTMGIKRNLSAEEIVGQIIYYARRLKEKNERVSNVVFMGMGEPMHNYDEVMKAIHILNDPEGFELGARRISISTCGVVPGILRLADEPLQINLAISLHSAIDEVRSKIMPVNRAYSIKKLMDAVAVYMEKTNRKVMFEYLLLKGINDREEDAQALARLLKPYLRLSHVNLIKYHQTEAFAGTERSARIDFLYRLHELGIPATHRITFGEDIDAACGQLAVREESGNVVQGLAAVRAAKRA